MNKESLIGLLKDQGFPQKIVEAFEEVRREDFVSEEFREQAYLNEPLPIGYNQTISQPSTIAFMLNLMELKDGFNILEVGSGSGYVLALINSISKNSMIYGMEIVEGLVEQAEKNLEDYKNIEVIQGNGRNGLKSHEPFDRILVSASSEKIPKELFKQLSEGGIMVCVVGDSVFAVKKSHGQKEIKEYPGFSFVPLVE